jgi:hypothetical protein
VSDRWRSDAHRPVESIVGTDAAVVGVPVGRCGERGDDSCIPDLVVLETLGIVEPRTDVGDVL